MNASQNIQTNSFPVNESVAGNRTVTGIPRGTALLPASANQGTVAEKLEQMQQYITHMERLLLCKYFESSELQKQMETCLDEEKTKRMMNEQVLIHQARHAAMGEVLGIVAHNWRQPLNAIALITQNMVDAWKYGELNSDLMERLAFRAMEQINKLSHTIDDFRSFLDPNNTTDHFDPVESVNLVVDLLSGWFSDFSAVDIRILNESDKALLVEGRQHAFQQVIFNLLCNSNDAIQERKRGLEPISRGIMSVRFKCTDDEIVISFADNGGGIDESIRAQIFEPYFTTKHKADGFGIGLFMSKLIIENTMHGNLCFENIPGGARFSIRLPRLSAERRGL